jgi:low affinity Fe/Cu permease
MGSDKRPSRFTRISQAAARWTSRSMVLLAVIAGVVVAGFTGPHFDYDAAWQLVMSTSVTIVTFLIVQTSQNRAMIAMQIKLDELLKAVDGARERLVDIENLDEEQLEEMQQKIQAAAGGGASETR